MKYKVNIPRGYLTAYSAAKLLVASLKEVKGKVHSSSAGWQSAVIECSPEDLTWLVLKVGITMDEIENA